MATTISEMKLDVNPIMAMRATACMARMAVKVEPKAPSAGGEPILRHETGVMSESRGREEQCAVRRGRCLL